MGLTNYHAPAGCCVRPSTGAGSTATVRHPSPPDPHPSPRQAFQICFGEYRTAPTNEGLHYELPLSDSDSEAALSGGGNSGDEDDGDAEDGDTGAGGGGFGASQVAERLRQRRKGLRRAEAARKQALELLEQWAGSERLRRLDAAEDELCAAVLQLEACAGRQGAGDAHGSAAVEGAEYPEGRQGAQGSEGGPAAASGGAGAADVGHGGGGREAGEGNGIGEGLQGGPGADPNWLLELEARVVAARAEFAEAWAAVQHVLEVRGQQDHATLAGSLDGSATLNKCLQDCSAAGPCTVAAAFRAAPAHGATVHVLLPLTHAGPGPRLARAARVRTAVQEVRPCATPGWAVVWRSGRRPADEAALLRPLSTR